MAFSQLQKLDFESVRLWEKVAQGNGCPSHRVGSTRGVGGWRLSSSQHSDRDGYEQGGLHNRKGRDETIQLKTN